ncbi:hypothetical protein COOONC_05557 [Cooperia oncophora]
MMYLRTQKQQEMTAERSSFKRLMRVSRNVDSAEYDALLNLMPFPCTRTAGTNKEEAALVVVAFIVHKDKFGTNIQLSSRTPAIISQLKSSVQYYQAGEPMAPQGLGFIATLTYELADPHMTRALTHFGEISVEQLGEVMSHFDVGDEYDFWLDLGNNDAARARALRKRKNVPMYLAPLLRGSLARAM